MSVLLFLSISIFLGLIIVINSMTGIKEKIEQSIAPLTSKVWIRIPPTAGPINLEVLKLTAVRITIDGRWMSSTSLGAKDILIGCAAEAINPINKQITNNELLFNSSVFIKENRRIEQIIIPL